MDKFYCSQCQKIFESEGEKRGWQSSIYGYCWKRIAKCPVCNKECDEHRSNIYSSKKKEDLPPSCACGFCNK